MTNRELAEPRRATAWRQPNRKLARASTLVLALSALALATTPIVVADSYSIFDHTLSESGGQDVDGAWLFRTGVVLASVGVFVLTYAAGELWPAVSRWLLRLYSLALLGAAWFSETPWDNRPHDETEAFLHTVFTVAAATAFILGVLAISRLRPHEQTVARVFDWLVVLAIAVLPQVSLITEGDGALQRTLVALGYAWLFVEANRIAQAHSARTRVAS